MSWREARVRLRARLPAPAGAAAADAVRRWRQWRALGPRLGRYAPQPCVHLPATDVPRAATPAIDAHAHLGRWLTQGEWAVPDVGALLELMDQFDIATVVNLDGRWDDELEANLDRYDRAHPGRFVTFCHVDWELAREAAFTERLVASLERSARAGARGLKVWKDLGLERRDPQGQLLLPDDPRLGPLWDTAGALGLPVLIHTGDPVAFFRPVDRRNERLEELLRHPRLSLFGRDVPPLERLIDALEATVAAHPSTRFIGAHVAGLAEDLTRADQLLQDYDNLWIDVGARLSELGRQPRATRRLIERHPDRVLFASDVVPPKATDYALWLRFLETDDEAFPYTATDPPPAGRWTISGLGLPRDLLQRVYRDNALAVLGDSAAES